MHIRDVAGDTPNTVSTSVVRTRRYLTGREVERLIEAARKQGCSTVTTETGAIEAGRPSNSYRNIVRAGFREAGIRANYRAP